MKGVVAGIALFPALLMYTTPVGAQLPKGYVHVGFGSASVGGRGVRFGTSAPAAALGFRLGAHEWIEFRLSRLSAEYVDYVGGFGDEGYNAYGATAHPFDVMLLNERPAVVAGVRPFLGAGLSLVPLEDRFDSCCGFEKASGVASGAIFAGGLRASLAGGVGVEMRAGYRLSFDLSHRPGIPLNLSGINIEGGLQWRW
ncbi:MAG: hypothetical protein V4558_12375 [Gemmatimonadota bacterium]